MEGVSRRVLVTTAVLVSLATCGSGYRCEVETIWGSTRYLNCPGSGDDPDAVFCCGSDDNKYCCASLIGEEALEDLIDKESIEQEEGAHLSPLVEMITPDKDRSIFTNMKGRLNHTIKVIKEGFEGTVDRLKERVKKKLKQKVKDKMVTSQ